jgi:ligand-binding sensor domain-containing protein/two-component sensor histidine kinase
MLRNILKLLLLVLINPQLIYAQRASNIANENILFHHLTTENGLPGDYINCILQDKKGFLWIGTTNGLCRYDGSRFQIYKNDPSDTFSLSDNNVISLLLDTENRMWVGTYWQGLNMLNTNGYQFDRFKNHDNANRLFANNSVPSINQLDSTHLIINQGELLILDIKNRTTEFIDLPKNTWSEKITNKTPDIFNSDKLFIDHQKKWWLTGESGIIQYDPALKMMNLFSSRNDIPVAFKNTSTWNCKEDIHGNIWIASGAGLFEYNRSSDQFIQHYPTNFLTADTKAKWVNTILCHTDGTIWFGTGNGLFHYSPFTGKYSVYRNNPKHSLSISDNIITYIYEDRQHIVWVGTSNGLNAVYPEKSAFNVYQNIPGDIQSLQSNLTHHSFKDDEGNIWIGTSKGLECINPATQTFSQYVFFDPHLKDPIEYSVMTLLPNDGRTCWVGTWGAGLQLFDTRKRKFIESFVHFSNSPLSINSNYIKSFCKDANGNLWIATWNGGIEKFNIKEKKFEHFNTSNKESGVTSNYVNKIYFYDHAIWATVVTGLLKYDTATNKFLAYRITNDTTNAMAAGAGAIAAYGNGNLLVGSGSGLTKFTIKNNQFEKLHTPGDDGVAAIYVDRHNKIWLATESGLKYYDPTTELIQVYTLKDGLPISYFPPDCYINNSADGEIMISSNSGLIHFFPEAINHNQIKPDLHITSVKVENEELKTTEDITQLKDVYLKYDQNYLVISFAALNLINPSQNQYAYKLESIDKDWVQSGNRNEVIYTNLPSGDYIFKVKASNNAAVWNEEGISLKIHINTPWWKTWWFYALCVITITLSIYTLYRIRINRIIAEHKLRNKIARDLHDDIGSTLSGIKLFSAMAQNKLQKERSGALDIVERIGERSEKMMEAMSDIVWSINPINDSFEKMLVRMKQYAAEMMEPKNIDYNFSANEKVSKAKIDSAIRKEIYLIFKEIINNAVKHSECTRVNIEMDMTGKNFEMIVSDNGIGIDLNSINGNGNGLNNFNYRAQEMGGEIKIISANKKGTTVKLIVPVT